ncbi:lipid phosphate phosphatase delta-like [Iris pallida]|uniref:Lipid phosphate phosphatase delta-like n=1 Tax=Iris pallida TaxID=29817 RepID=A0AAX6FBK1_IRIPA|nr:lipid phosphate phosphatase delta-like [Iris pallida]
MESSSSVPLWQAMALSSIAAWLFVSSHLDLTRRLRSLVQPWVTRRVQADTPLVLRVQRFQHGHLDSLFSLLSCVVSVPFYTGFLPLLFWSGHARLARQMTLLMAFCDYVGNSIKDTVSAPRPSCPPVRRVTATKDEKENAMEYGLPSSHALNTVCLSGYLLHYGITHELVEDSTKTFVGFGLVFLLVVLIGIGRIYLGMHSSIDVIAGISLGLVILSFWVSVHESIDDFIISGKNVTSFWAGLSFLVCFAYPTPEFPTPSYEYHAAFNGVAFGIVSGVQQTFQQFHSENVPRLFSPQLSLPVFLGRVLVGIPTILLVKYCSKAISKWLFPVVSNTLGIPVMSSCYIPALKDLDGNKNKSDSKLSGGYLHRLVALFPHRVYDVDTGIRFLQYAGLAWSVVDLVPSLFSRLSL